MILQKSQEKITFLNGRILNEILTYSPSGELTIKPDKTPESLLDMIVDVKKRGKRMD